MSRGLALTVVLSLGQHNLRNALAEMKCMYAHFGVKKFKINNIRRRRFCSAPLVWDQCREVAYQWAVANDIDLAWAAYDDFGSASPTWYISSRSSRYVEPFEKGHWELVQW